MKNNYVKTKNLYKIIFLFVVFLGIGYAFLEANLKVEGDTTVIAPPLNVYVQTTSVTTGSTSGTPAIIGNAKKEVDFSTALTNDGNSFFEEISTLLNNGTQDAYLLSIDVKVYDSNNNEVTLTTPYEYSLTNGDGTPVVIGHKLTVHSTETYKIKFNYITGTDMNTVTDYPTYTFKIIYNYGLEYIAVCSENENKTTLSSTKCSANENVTVPSGTVCKRAIKLHQEECEQTDNTNYCSGAGYTANGSKGTTTITYGNCGTQNSPLVSGDALTCDVNGDGEFNELTERFYYVSDYYNTSTLTFDSTIATLVYYNNVADGISCNKNIYAYNASNNNWDGPDTSRAQLPTTSQWTNVSLQNNSIRAILAEQGVIHNSRETVNPLPTAYDYSGYAARLLTGQELMSGCGFTTLDVGAGITGELDSCNYLMENTKYASEDIENYGPWLETPYVNDFNYIWYVDGTYRGANVHTAYPSPYYCGVRPTIEVPKANIAY